MYEEQTISGKVEWGTIYFCRVGDKIDGWMSKFQQCQPGRVQRILHWLVCDDFASSISRCYNMQMHCSGYSSSLFIKHTWSNIHQISLLFQLPSHAQPAIRTCAVKTGISVPVHCGREQQCSCIWLQWALLAFQHLSWSTIQTKLVILAQVHICSLKSQVLKIQKFVGSCPTPLFCLSCELPGIESRSTAQLSTTMTSKPNTQVKECYLFIYKKPFCSAEWWTLIF